MKGKQNWLIDVTKFNSQAVKGGPGWWMRLETRQKQAFVVGPFNQGVHCVTVLNKCGLLLPITILYYTYDYSMTI